MKILLTLAAAMIAFPALAQTPTSAPAQPRVDRFEAADTNKDGMLSRAEWDAMRADQKAKWAGKLGARHAGGWDAFVAKADTNKDGAISKAEWDAAGRKPEGFTRMDLNNDGKITQAEMQEARNRMKVERAAR
jgi:hypothetical protein